MTPPVDVLRQITTITDSRFNRMCTWLVTLSSNEV